MISFLLTKLKLGTEYVRQHPQLILLFVLMIVLPTLSVLTNQAYLKAAESIQNRVYKDRVGIMQDTFGSLLRATDFDPDIAQTELNRIASVNEDILEFRVAKLSGNDIVPIAALNETVIKQPESNPQFYTTSMSNPDQSFIYANGQQWYVYRSIITDDSRIYFIYTKFSLVALASVKENVSSIARPYFIALFLFILVIGYWHFKLTDYRYLYRKAENANKMKDLFTNMIAHELRAPLTAIRGYASMIEEKTEGEQHEYSVRVRESSERLLAIVNDLLDVARIQSGKLSIEKEDVDISPIIHKVIDELRVSGKEKSISLETEGADVEHVLIADPKRLHQALTNLVSNSIKYTKHGSITISVKDNLDKVEIRVKDTGMGISSEDQKKLFAPFFRVQSEDVSAITGTGLGMWITKQLIELMDGFISVESIKGVGTHIIVKFPKKKS